MLFSFGDKFDMYKDIIFSTAAPSHPYLATRALSRDKCLEFQTYIRTIHSMERHDHPERRMQFVLLQECTSKIIP